MKKLFYVSAPLIYLFFACDMKKVELPQDLRNELEASKPIIITEAEVSGVAQEIADSLFKNLKFITDTSYIEGKHKVKIIGKNHKSLAENSIKDQYDAYSYSFASDSNFKPIGTVKYDKTKNFALYQNAILQHKDLKLILIEIDLSEVNLKVVRDRKQKKNQAR